MSLSIDKLNLKYSPDVVAFKLEARALKKLQGISSSAAHEVLAISYGFKSYNAFLSEKGHI